MLRRAFTVVLALLLCWSSLATLEGFAPADAAWGDAGDVAVALESSRGSLDVHHLDDQPLPPHADPGGDLPAWLAAAPTQMILSPSSAAPPSARASARPRNVADVPQRPPRA